RDVTKLRPTDRISAGGMCTNRIGKLPLVGAPKLGSANYRYGIRAPESCVFTAGSDCSVDDFTRYRVAYKNYATIMAGDTVAPVGHRADFKGEDLASIFVMGCQMRGSL